MTETQEAVNATDRREPSASAYTLVELLAVVGIVVLLAVLTAPALVPMMRRRALRQGAMQMKAALLQLRTSAIAQESGRVAIMPINLRAQPPQWVIPTKISEWFGGSGSSYPKMWDGDSWEIE